MTGRARVFVVDDHALFRAGVRAELGATVDIVGDAGDVDTAITGIVASQPEVVLLDVHLPGGGGRAVIEAVRTTAPDVRFLALSVSDAAEDVIGLIRAGARGYVTKTITARSSSTPSRGSAAATPCSPPGWPASCSTPSPATSRRPSTQSSTSSPRGSAR